MGPRGQDPRSLTSRGSSARDADPAFGPHGDQVAFASSRDGTSKIYVLDPAGGDARPVSDGAEGGDSEPAWSPDERQIVFVRGARRDLYAVDASGGAPARLLLAGADDEPQGAGAPSWSPDGKTIVFAGARGESLGMSLWLVDADGSGLRRLTHAPRPERWTRDVHPSWSPDGKRIAFASNRHASSEVAAEDLDIYVVTVADGSLVRLTRDPAVADDPCWSPDGRRVFFTSTRDAPTPYSHELYVMPAAGGEQRRLTRDAIPLNTSCSTGRIREGK